MTALPNENRVCLAVMECQTLHYGHMRLLTQMLATSINTPVIGLGSCRKSGVYGHPFTFDQRKEMIQLVFRDCFRFVELDDIDSSIDNNEWTDYVISRITSRGLRPPTDCFSGSAIDAKWYENAFAPIHDATETRTAVSTIYENRETGKRLHIIDRNAGNLPSGRDIRFLIERRDDEWKRFVPEVLHSYIEAHYPPALRQAIRGVEPPSAEDHPVGTRYIANNTPNILFELKDDGKWRPLLAKDEKADFARAMHDQRKKK